MTRIDPATHLGDDLSIRLTVSDTTGTAVDLTGAVVEARALLRGVGVEPAAITITDNAAGQVLLDFARRLGAAGEWRVQARILMPAGDRQTVLDAVHRVERSVL